MRLLLLLLVLAGGQAAAQSVALEQAAEQAALAAEATAARAEAAATLFAAEEGLAGVSCAASAESHDELAERLLRAEESLARADEETRLAEERYASAVAAERRAGGISWTRYACGAFLLLHLHRLTALGLALVRLSLPATLRERARARAPHACALLQRAAALAVPAAAAVSARYRDALVASLGAAVAGGAWALQRLSQRQPDSPEERAELHADYVEWVAELLAGGGRGSPRGDPGLEERRAAAAAARRAAEEDARASRYERYARAAATDSPSPAEESEAAPPEEEVARLLRLVEGLASPGAHRFRGRAGDAAWRKALRLPARAAAGAAEVARAHRRLSSLVHPDKCAHPRAGEAQALLNAARDGLLGLGEGEGGDGSDG